MTHPQTPHWCGNDHCTLNAPSKLNPVLRRARRPGGTESRMHAPHRTRRPPQRIQRLHHAALYGAGASLWAWALAAAFLTPWYWLMFIAGAVLIMTGGSIPQVDDPDEDDWFNPEHRPVWPNDAGSPE